MPFSLAELGGYCASVGENEVPESPRSLVFSVRPHTNNIGNDLIALATSGLLDSVWFEPVDVVGIPSSGPQRGPKSCGLDHRNVYEANCLADAVIVGGGNLFENGALSVEQTALDALQVPLGLLAVSNGRVRDRRGNLVGRTDSVSAQQIRALCERADPLLVRDGATARILGDLGVGNVALGGCPTLFLDRYVHDLAPASHQTGRAIISLRHPKLMSVPYADQGRVAGDVERLITGLRERFDSVAVLCHDYQDLSFARSLEGIDAVEMLYTEDPRRFLGWLRSAAVVVGYRLHGFLACISLDVPAIHVSYDERGESMVETLGVEAHNVRLHETPDVASEVLDRIKTMSDERARSAAAPAMARMHAVMTEGVTRLSLRARDARQAATAQR